MKSKLILVSGVLTALSGILISTLAGLTIAEEKAMDDDFFGDDGEEEETEEEFDSEE